MVVPLYDKDLIRILAEVAFINGEVIMENKTAIKLFRVNLFTRFCFMQMLLPLYYCDTSLKKSIS